MTFWNCDGSPANMCGNAALCSTRLSVRLGMARRRPGWSWPPARDPFPTRCVGRGRPGRAEPAGFRPPGTGARHGLAGQASAGSGGPLSGCEHLVTRVDDLEGFDFPGPWPGAAVPSRPSPPRGPTPTTSPNRSAAGAPGASGPTNAGSRGKPWHAAPAPWPPRWRWPPRGGRAAARPSYRGAAGSWPGQGHHQRGQGHDVWLRGEARLVFTGYTGFVAPFPGRISTRCHDQAANNNPHNNL